MKYSLFSINDLVEQMGLVEVEGMLQSFACPLNIVFLAGQSVAVYQAEDVCNLSSL